MTSVEGTASAKASSFGLETERRPEWLRHSHVGERVVESGLITQGFVGHGMKPGFYSNWD